jgi:hypothetical protein
MLALGITAIVRETQLSAYGYGSDQAAGYNKYTFAIAGVSVMSLNSLP